MVLALLARATAPPTQTLHTLQPTPSTVSFTVSTRPVPVTVAAKLAYYVGLLTRVLLGICALLLLWTKWRISYGHSTDTLLYLLGGPRTAALLKDVGGLGWQYVAPGAIAVLYMVLRRGYTGMYTSRPASLHGLMRYRGVVDFTTWAGRADELFCFDSPAVAEQSIHTHQRYPGHLHTRGVQRVRGQILPCYCSQGRRRHCCGVPKLAAKEGDS